MGLGDLIRNVTDALTGDRKPDQPEVRPASEDPYGDPADPLAGQNIRPASEDPYGDPADQLAGQDIRPASEDPYGDPADLPYGANVRPASEDPFGDPADAGGIYDAVQQQLGATDPAWTRQQVERHVGMLPAGQADNLAGTVMNLISQSGVDVNGLCSRLGFSPDQCGAHLSQLLGYLHQNHPDALAQAASREPGLAGLLSDPSAGGILGSLASRFLGGRR